MKNTSVAVIVAVLFLVTPYARLALAQQGHRGMITPLTLHQIWRSKT